MCQFIKENIMLFLCGAVLLLIALYPFHYGYFCDELYYIALSKHLAWGYVDVPPLMPLCLSFVRVVFGESLFAIHLLSGVIGVMILIITSKTVKKLGGDFFAQSLALVGMTLSPILINHTCFMSYDTFNGLFWALALYSLLGLLLTENKKYWLYFGLAAGFGLLSKFDMLFLGAGLTLAMFLISDRKYFCTWQFWGAGFIAILIALPYFVWIATHDFLTIKYFMGYSKALASSGTGAMNFFEFIKDQIIVMNPLTFPICIAGLYYFLFNNVGKRFRLLGLTYLAIFILNFITHAKFYVISPFYFMLLSGGAVYVEKLVASPVKAQLIRFLKGVYLGLLILLGLILLPYMRPVLLPDDHAISYIHFLNRLGLTIQYGQAGALPQWFADAFGWEEMAAQVARIYYKMPLAERQKTLIFAASYSQASAIDFYRKKYGLPMPISTHDQYYIWGIRDLKQGSNMIIVGYDARALKFIKTLFKSVQQVDYTYNKYTMPYNNRPIYLGRYFIKDAKQVWKQKPNMTM